MNSWLPLKIGTISIYEDPGFLLGILIGRVNEVDMKWTANDT